MTAPAPQSQPANARPPFDATQILLGIVGCGLLGAVSISVALLILYAVGETVEHFTP